MKQIPQVILVDDHALFREGIRLLIEHEQLGKVIAEANNGNEFLKLLNNHNPDIVLMDIEMPGMNGYEATVKARNLRPNLKILVITMQDRKEDYIKMVDAGVMGFVLKTSGKEELQKAIATVLAGEQYFCNEILQKVVSDLISNPAESPSNRISERLTLKELQVLEYLCKGFTPTEIAQKIHRSIKTVEAHRSKLLEKTNTKNTINLVLYAIKNKLVVIN